MELCPCGSEKAYTDCCQPLITGERVAETARR
ncbi:SEC-C metal-binding domain-containing protein [Desulfosarcina cetonica]|nr:SEC-C metal-binding domain-containing protein [Desulfosarcina cetonica]